MPAPGNRAMNKLIIVVLIICAAVFGLRTYRNVLNPEVIVNPVYAEVRIRGDSPRGPLELVTFAKTVDQEDCLRGIHVLEGVLTPQVRESCPTCAVAKSECTPELPLRYAKLFDDEPTSVTYFSFARGARTEREFRMVVWGVTAEESDQFCNTLLPRFQKKHIGAVKCIRPH